MNLTLEPIPFPEDKTKAMYASENCQNLLQMWEEYYPKIGYHFPWVGYFVKHEDLIIGTAAFTGQPIDNKVEISYWTFKEFEGLGVASFAAKELIAIAKSKDSKLIITAKTAPEKNASVSVLENNGFVFSGIVQDHEIGDAWEWKLE